MPKYGVHKITEKNMDTRTGICSSCGPIDLTLRGCCAERTRIAAKSNKAKDPVGKKRYMAQYLLDNKERLQAYHRENWHYGQFGISKDNFAKLLASQGGCCGICKTTNPGAGKTWHLDHDHKYDKKDPQGHRGLLCHRCNVALGLFGDSVVNLQAAIAYLARQKEAAE